jgi:excisionase family DNA binding protein
MDCSDEALVRLSNRGWGRWWYLSEAMQGYLTLVDVAGRLGVSIHNVRHWVRTGRLASCRPGRRRLVRASDLEVFLARNTRGQEQGRSGAER